MRVAALYDVHGMLDALEAVLAEVAEEAVDVVLVGGDAVGGPQPAETLHRLQSVGDRVRWVRGNTERALVDGPAWVDESAHEALAWTAARLSADERSFLAALPQRQVLRLDGLGRVVFCHATPRSDLEIVTEATPDAHLREVLAGVEADLVVSGHTHMQLDRRVDGVRWVNAGSVGMPFEGDVAAFWALLDTDVSFRKTSFDVEAAAETILATGWPEAEAFVAGRMRRAARREEAIAEFERRAIARGERLTD